MTRKRLLFWAVVVGFIAIDQAVKWWIRGAIPEGGSFHGQPWPGVFELTLTYNTGIAFGKLQGFGQWMTPIALAIAAGSVWYSERHSEEGLWTHISFGLLASGALGNLFDRLWLGRVTDMFYFRPINFPVFNVADACISVATVMLLIGWWFEAAHRHPHVERQDAHEVQEIQGHETSVAETE